MDFEKLIVLVHEQEFLYKYNDKNYHDAEKKESVWRAIGKKLNQSAKECKKQWTALRDGYRRHLKKRKIASGQAAIHAKKWKYEDEMGFLQPFLKDRATISSSNISNSSNAEVEPTKDENEITLQQTESASVENITLLQSQSTTRKNKYDYSGRPVFTKKMKTSQQTSATAVVMKYLLEKKNEKQDEIEALFYSLAQTVKKMNPYYRALTKARVCSIVSELEIQNLMHPSVDTPYTSISTSFSSPTSSHISNSSTRVSTPMSSLLSHTLPTLTNQVSDMNSLDSTSELYNEFSCKLETTNTEI